MSHPLLSLPAHLRRRLIGALEAGTLRPGSSPAAVRSVLELREGAEAVCELLSQMDAMQLSSATAAAWIKSVEEAGVPAPPPDLVWVRPGSAGTARAGHPAVYAELLGGARQSILASSYAYFDGPQAFAVLARRMDEVAELRVTLLLNIQRKRGDTSTADDVVRRFADRFWGNDLAGDQAAAGVLRSPGR